MKFRKKPVVIDAEQWFPGQRAPEGVYTEAVASMPPDIQQCVEFGINPDHPRAAAIKTLEAWHLVTPGDWIITGVKGEKYLCKPDIFAMTYDAVAQSE